MSYRCEVCKEAQEIGTAPTLVVVATRDKIYADAGRICQEIAREVSCCPPCAETTRLKLKEAELLEQQAKEKEIADNAAAFNAPKFGDRPSEWRSNV
jgi:hypothetical protein